MTTTNTIPSVKVSTDSVLSGDVFFGSFDTVIKGKKTTVTVSNHIKDLKATYNFRVASKCKAGFINISDWETTPENIISSWITVKYFGLMCLQLRVVSGIVLTFHSFKF